MLDLDGLITDLEAQVAELEAGKQLSYPVDREQLYQLDEVEAGIQEQGYTLSKAQMQEAAQIGSVFADTVAELPLPEQEVRLKAARDDKDVVTLYLLSKYAPSDSIRERAKSFGTDTEQLAKVHKCRSLFARLRHLEAMSPYQRKELARSLGYNVPEDKREEPITAATIEEQKAALMNDYMYSM